MSVFSQLPERLSGAFSFSNCCCPAACRRRSDMGQPYARREFIPTLAEIFFGRLANLWRKRRVERATPRRRPQFQSIEPRILLSADLLFNAVDNLAHDDYTLRLDAESGDLQLLDSTTVVASRPLAETTGVVINGEDGWNDSLKIDFSQGGFFSLDGGITFNGGEDGFDALEVTGGTFTSVIHTVTDAGPGLSGTMVYEDGLNPALTINYTGLEPVDMTGSTIADLVFNLPGTNDQAILEDDGTPGNGISQLRSQNATPTFDTTTFTNPTGSLTVNMGGDNGTFTVASLPDFTRSLTINGQAGTDNVTFTGAMNLSSAGADLSITVTGSIVDAAGASLQVNDLATFNADSITLGENAADTTNFGSLTFNAAGAVNITEDSAMVLTGNNVGSSATLVSSGTMTISALRTTGPGAVDLLSSGVVTLNGDIVTRGGAVTIFNSVVLGSPATVTIDTTDSGNPVPVPSGRSIVITGTVNDDLAPTGLVLNGGTVGTVSLQGAVGGTTPIQGLTAQSGNLVILQAVRTRDGGLSVSGANGITLNGSINTNQGDIAGNVFLVGPVTLANSSINAGDGTVNAQGTVHFSGIGAITAGTFNAGTLSISSGTSTLNAPTTVSTLNVSGGTLVADDTLTATQANISGGGIANLNGENGESTIGNLSLTGGGTAGLVGGLGGIGNVTLLAGGAHSWNSGLLSGRGGLTVASGATLTVGGGDHVANGKPIVNAGTVNWTAGRIDLGGGNSTFANQGVFELAANNQFGDVLAVPGTVPGSMVLTNTGLIRQQVAVITTFSNSMTVNNQGQGADRGVVSSAGRVNFGGNGGTHSGDFNAVAGATLAFTGGTHNFDPGSRVTVAGTLAVGGSGTQVNLDTEANLSGAIVVDGVSVANINPTAGSILPTTITVGGSSGTLNLAPPNATTMAPAQVTISGGGTLNINDRTAPAIATTATIGNLSLTGGGTAGLAGGLGGSGDVTLLAGGAHSWNSGLLSGSGVLTVASGATLTVGGGDHVLNGKPIVNAGTVNWTAGRIDLGGGNFTFANQGVFELAANSQLGDILAVPGTVPGTVVLNNTGLIRQQENETTTFSNGVTVNNQGIVQVSAGTVSVVGTLIQNGTVELANDATFLKAGGFTSSGVLRGSGTFNVGAGTLSNTGTVAPGATGDATGTLSISGNYRQETNGKLEIELAGLGAGDFDVLAVSGTATIVGNALLDADLINPFTPLNGDRFRFMTFTARIGDFVNTLLPAESFIDTGDTFLELVYLNAAPSIAIDKTVDANEDGSFASSESVLEGGAGNQLVDYRFIITNTSPAITDPVTLVVTGLTDDRLGDLTGAFLAANGGSATITVGQSVTFFVRDFLVPVANAGSSHVNTVSVVALDDEGTETQGTDSATVTYADAAPTVTIDKTVDANEDGSFASTESVLEGGVGNQQVDYRFVVSNSSAASTDPLTVTALFDDELGDLMAAFVSANNGSDTLAVGQAVTFFVQDFLVPVGNVGDFHTNVVTVNAADDEGSVDSDIDLARVTYADVSPSIVTDKTVDANGDGVFSDTESVLEGGVGDQLVDYRFVVSNTSAVSTDPLLVLLTDDRLGDLTAAFAAANNGSNTLAVGQSVTFFVRDFLVPVANAGSSHVNTVSVVALDDEGTETQAADFATVTYANAAPTVVIDKSVDTNGDGVFASSESVSEGDSGHLVDYRFVVANASTASTDPLTLTELSDDKLRDLFAAFVAANNGSSTLAVGQSVTFFVLDAAVPAGNAGDSHVNTVTVTAADDEGTGTQSTDVATVTFEAAGGSIVTYTATQDLLEFSVADNQDDNVTVTSPGVNQLRVLVGGGTITLVGATAADDGDGFTLSNGGTQLDIDTSLAPVNLFGIDLSDGDDTLTIDFGSGSVLPVSGGISFNGGTGTDDSDELVVTGGSFASATHTFTTNGPEHSGNIVYHDGSNLTSISYTGLEPVDMSGSTIANLVFKLPGTDDQAILEDNVMLGDGSSQIRSQNSASTFDTTIFSNPTSSLTVNMGGDSGSLTVDSLPDFTRSLTINGEAGSDTVVFSGAVGFSALSVRVGGSITDTADADIDVAGNASFTAGGAITLGDEAGDVVNFGTLTFVGPLIFVGGDVSISEDSSAVLTGVSTASRLSLTAAGSITDDADADIDVAADASFVADAAIALGDQAGNVTNFGSLTFNATGAVSISEDSDTTIRTGIVLNNDINLLSPGALLIIEGLNAGAGDIRLVANTVAQTGLGVITANELGMLTANVTLVAADNDVNTLAVESPPNFIGHIAVRDIDDLTIGVVTAGGGAGFSGATGIFTTNSGVTLIANEITVSSRLDNGTNAINLTAAGGVFFASSAVLNVNLGGTGPLEFTVVTISGAVSLGGTLNAELVNGFSPIAGNSFPFMTFGSRDGSFDDTVLPDDFILEESATQLTLVYAPQAGGIDLTIGEVSWDPEDLLIPGDREHVTVTVLNIGDTPVHDQVRVKLYASADEVFDGSDFFLAASRTDCGIEPGGSRSAQFDVKFPSTLLPGEYFLLAVADPANLIAESNELNNTALGDVDGDGNEEPDTFDFRWMFGSVPDHGRETLLVRDADGTKVLFALAGPGTGEITIDENGDWDLVVTGTRSWSVLTILTLGGGDNRVEIDDIHVTGALGAILAPKVDVTGTLAIDGVLGAGMMIGSATDAVIAVQTILGNWLSGLSVQGIAILGDLEDSEILIGADLGADGQLGGSGADADTYSEGDLGDLRITGSMISSIVRVGQDPVDGIFDNGDDVLLDGSIDSIRIYGEMSDDSFFVADDLPLYARIDGEKVYTATDPRFIDSLPASGGDPECDIDWSGSYWGAGYYSPYAASRYSNFSDFLRRLF